jgi:hypothetical protein
MPKVVEVSPELREAQKRWLQAERGERDVIYARQFGPAFIPEFAKLPLHGAPGDFVANRPRALVSILGMSWQPVALMAAHLRPERVLIIGTRESLEKQVDGEPVFEVIVRLSGLHRDCFETPISVPDGAEQDIYDAVRQFVARHGLGSRGVAIDPTGGKKSMSVAAGLAGFLEGAWLVYVDYLEYDPKRRIPVAGSEYPRLLANPLERRGDLELEQIRKAFDGGGFDEAAARSRALYERVYETRLAELHLELARGYGAWDAFRIADAIPPLEKVAALLGRFRGRNDWAPLAEKLGAIEEQLAFLKELQALFAGKEKPASREQGMPLVINHLAAARRAFGYGRTSIAVMLLYAAVEKFVDLCLWAPYGLDDENPDYGRLPPFSAADLKRYHGFGRQYFGDKYVERQLEGPLQYANGLQLLSTLEPGLELRKETGPLKGLAVARNGCEFEHGLPPRPARREDFERFEAAAIRVVARVEGEDRLKAKLASLAFPRLG